MSIALLGQIYEETRRLAIAGSSVAADDFRLKKLIPPLQQAAEKSPVFAKLASGVQQVVDSDQQNAADALLELGTLINAVQYTQGETGVKGELRAIESKFMGVAQTQTSARLLKPLLDALTTTGSGRFEIIRDAHERDLMRDMRLVAPALYALDDTYTEIADFVAENILPLYGKAIVSELDRQFNPKGKAGQVRRLLLMHQLDLEVARPHVLQALDEGTKEMRVAAISCLGDSPEDLAFLLEQAKAKTKDVRRVALRSLGRSRASEALAMLRQCIDGKDLELAVPALQASHSPVIVNSLLQAIKLVRDEMLALATSKGKDADKKKQGQTVARLLLLLGCLPERKDDGTRDVCAAMFADRSRWLTVKSDPGGEDVIQRVAEVLSAGSPAMQRVLVDAHEDLSAELMMPAFAAAIEVCDPEEAFDLFHPYLSKPDPAKGRRRGRSAYVNAIAQVLHGGNRRKMDDQDFQTQHQAMLQNMSPRWLESATVAGERDLVMLLARPGHPLTERALREVFQDSLASGKSIYDMFDIVELMLRMRHPDAEEAVLASIQTFTKSTYYHFSWFGRLIPMLSKETAVPKLETLLPSLPHKVSGQLIDYVVELKNQPE